MKKIFYLSILFFVVLFVLVLSADEAQAQAAEWVSISGFAVVPPPPPIGSIKVLPSQSKGNLNKMGADGIATFQILDSSGKPYPLQYTGYKEIDVKPLGFETRVRFDVVRGDGKTIPDMNHAGLGGLGLVHVESSFSVAAKYIRKQAICQDRFWYPNSSTNCSTDISNYLTNPLVPGDVILSRVEISVVYAPAGEGMPAEVVLAQYSINPGLKLFTVALPPKLDSLDKSSAKFLETVTINGSNFDVGAEPAEAARGGNKIVFDLNRNAGLDVVNGSPNTVAVTYSRIINFYVFSGLDDFVHYCGPNKIKFEVPPDAVITPAQVRAPRWETTPMSTGRHTLTLVNEFGYSNTVEINLTGAGGVPEDDLACIKQPGTITSIQPTSGPLGTLLTINGTGFYTVRQSGTYGPVVSANMITIGGVRAGVVGFKYEQYRDAQGFLRFRSNQIQVCVPSNAISGKVKVKPVPVDINSIIGPQFTITSGSITCNVPATPTATPITSTSVSPSQPTTSTLTSTINFLKQKIQQLLDQIKALRLKLELNK